MFINRLLKFHLINIFIIYFLLVTFYLLEIKTKRDIKLISLFYFCFIIKDFAINISYISLEKLWLCFLMQT